MGQALPKHAGSRERAAVSRDLLVRRDERVRWPRHADRVSGDRCAVARSRGAPIKRMRASPVVGVEVTATEFTPIAPTDGKYPGVPLKGLRLRVLDREHYDPTRLAVVLLAALRAAHPTQFQFRAESFDRLAAGPELRMALEAGRPAADIGESWARDLQGFRETRARYLIY